jgi:hypothetical protein
MFIFVNFIIFYFENVLKLLIIFVTTSLELKLKVTVTIIIDDS